MIHAKFQDHRTSSSGEEDFFKVFTIYGHHNANVSVLIKFSQNTSVFTLIIISSP